MNGIEVKMSREIKFRAWDTILNRMYPAFEMKEYMSVNEMGQDNLVPQTANEIELMQFTGLKDKNGKEIYEGDLITESVNSCKWIYEIRSCEEFGINLFKVLRYRNFDTDENGDHIYGDFWMDTVYSQLREGKYSIVIGNIYENPELLKQDTLCACKEVKEQDENTPEKR